jgi:hypothetical protein
MPSDQTSVSARTVPRVMRSRAGLPGMAPAAGRWLRKTTIGWTFLFPYAVKRGKPARRLARKEHSVGRSHILYSE